MAIFDGAIKTKTRVPLGKDAFQPGMGVLTKSSPFAEEIRITGDVSEKIIGNFTSIVVKDVKRTIIGSLTTTIITNETRTTTGNTTLTRTGTTTVTNVAAVVETSLSTRIGTQVGALMNTIVSPETRVTLAIKNLLNGTGPAWIDVKQNSTTLVLAMNTSMGSFNNCFFIKNTEAYASQVNLLGIDQALKGMEGSLKGLEDNIGFLGIKVKALKNDTKAVAGNIGASVGTGPGLGNVANGPFPGVGSAP